MMLAGLLGPTATSGSQHVLQLADANDRELVHEMAAGIEDALGRFYDRWHADVYSAAWTIVRDALDADEVVETTFWQVWKNAADYDDTRSTVRGWLFTITRSRAIDCLRSRRRRREEFVHRDALDALRGADASADPSAPAEHADAQRHITKALATLTAEQREVLELAFFGGLSHTEIAERLLQPLGTVKTRMRLALRRLHGGLSILNA